jgi:hypothetical protein
MERRIFIQSTLATATLPFIGITSEPINDTKEWYELRNYEIKFGANPNLLVRYLKEVLQVAMKAIGVNHFHIFNEYGKSDPRKIWVLISYPSAEVYLKAQQLASDASFLKAAADYNTLPMEQKIFNRFESSLLLAFDRLATMQAPPSEAGLFELRIYEGYSEDAVNRKIKMFNLEEIDLFYKVGLSPVFFGEMLAGKYRPCLAYMLYFKDMEERDTNWADFSKHPDWNTMKVKKEYADSVSNIIRVFLTPLS